MRLPQPQLIWAQPSRPARRLLLHLFLMGLGVVRERTVYSPFDKPGVTLSWITRGRGTLELASRRWELRPPPYFNCYASDQERVFVPLPGHPLVVRFLWFGGPTLAGWLDELDSPANPLFRVRSPSRIFRAYDRLLHLVQERPPAWEWRVHMTLTTVLNELRLARSLFVRPENTFPPPLLHALNALEADRPRNWKARELAAAAGLSYSKFRWLFRKHLDETPHEHIQRVRLDYARELLADSRLRIKEIASRLHFPNEHYFSTFFRRGTGITPTDFRLRLGVQTK